VYRLVQLLDCGTEGSSPAELAGDGDGIGTDRIAIAIAGGLAVNLAVVDNSDRPAPLHLASSGETDPIPYRMEPASPYCCATLYM